MTDIWERVREHQERYQRMLELEKELGVCDPEREALDDALVARVSRALQNQGEGLARMKVLGMALDITKPAEGQ